MQTHRASDRIEARAVAVGTDFAIALLPAKPGLLDGIGPRAPLYVRQIKQLAKAAAFRAPTLSGIVAEHFRVQRLERAAAFRTGAFGRMDRQFASIIEREQCPVSHLQSLIDERLRIFG